MALSMVPATLSSQVQEEAAICCACPDRRNQAHAQAIREGQRAKQKRGRWGVDPVCCRLFCQDVHYVTIQFSKNYPIRMETVGLEIKNSRGKRTGKFLLLYSLI